MKGIRRNATFCLCILFIGSMVILSTNKPHSDPIRQIVSLKEEQQIITAIDPSINYTEYWGQACSSVIVTGNASKDGRAILMKNRDWPYDPANVPIYVPSTDTTYAYIGVNTNTMGINQWGLAVMNTALPILARSQPVEGNLILNQKILESYYSVSAIAHALNDSRSPIGPTYRASFGNVATCIGVIDRSGAGAFFEISNTKAYVQYVVDGYDTRANHPRIYSPYAAGPSGRDQYLLDALDEVYEKNGYISWEHVMQNVSRYVRHKELGSVNFSIDGEACNPNTVATMVAVSGDSRYGGQLNCMWTACGPNPITSVFVPTMVCAESIPTGIVSTIVRTQENYESAQVQTNPVDPILLNPERVREVQKYAFFAESYSIAEYDRLMSSVPEGLSDFQLKSTVEDFIDSMANISSDIFIGETTDVVFPPLVSFPNPTPSSTASTPVPSSTPSTSTTTGTLTESTSTPSESLFDIQIVAMVVGFGSGFALVMIAAIMYRRLT